jgi:hypothetical protein
MIDEALVRNLRNLSDLDFIETFYAAAAGRHLYPDEEAYVQSHLVLANAKCDRSDEDGPWSAWSVELLCPAPGQLWASDAPVCQFGNHCGFETASWAKEAVCPVCHGEAYGT